MKDTTEAREKLDRAHDLVGRLASGDEKWTMCIPARPERDSDLVLSDALRLGERLADRVDELEAVLVALAEDDWATLLGLGGTPKDPDFREAENFLTEGSYDIDARYVYPEREALRRRAARAVLNGSGCPDCGGGPVLYGECQDDHHWDDVDRGLPDPAISL